MADERLVFNLSSGGDVVIKLRPDLAPGHVERITELTKSGFYDGIPFHRVISGFMMMSAMVVAVESPSMSSGSGSKSRRTNTRAPNGAVGISPWISTSNSKTRLSARRPWASAGSSAWDSRYGSGAGSSAQVATFDLSGFKNTPKQIVVNLTDDNGDGMVTVFLVNRHLTESMDLDMPLTGA